MYLFYQKGYYNITNCIQRDSRVSFIYFFILFLIFEVVNMIKLVSFHLKILLN